MKALTSSAHKIAFRKIFFYAEKRESIALPFLCVNVFTYDNTAQRNIPLKTIFYSPLSFKHYWLSLFSTCRFSHTEI